MREGMIPRRLAGVGTLGLVVGLLLLIVGGPAGATHVDPDEVAGNPTCGQLGAWQEILKIEPVESGTYTGDNGEEITITVTDTEAGQVFDFVSDTLINGVFVKGGPGGNLYDYGDAGTLSDDGLHAPFNEASEKWFGLSHISFCVLAEEETTTTTEAATTTTTEAATTTTTEAATTTTVEVLPTVVTTTTTAAAPVVTVLPAQVTTTTVAAVAETLPFTGPAGGSLAGLGAALVTMGGLMLATVRLRKRWAE